MLLDIIIIFNVILIISIVITIFMFYHNLIKANGAQATNFKIWWTVPAILFVIFHFGTMVATPYLLHGFGGPPFTQATLFKLLKEFLVAIQIGLMIIYPLFVFPEIVSSLLTYEIAPSELVKRRGEQLMRNVRMIVLVSFVTTTLLLFLISLTSK